MNFHYHKIESRTHLQRKNGRFAVIIEVREKNEAFMKNEEA